MLKKVQVVMLPAEKEDLIYFSNTKSLKDIGSLSQHLYFTTDEEIKERDWMIHPIEKEVHQAESFWYNNYKQSGYTDFRKIVATTNPDLWTYTNLDLLLQYTRNTNFETISLPTEVCEIGADFIEVYVREQGNIKEIMLEYELINNSERLKLHNNGTVIIHYK